MDAGTHPHPEHSSAHEHPPRSHPGWLEQCLARSLRSDRRESETNETDPRERQRGSMVCPECLNERVKTDQQGDLVQGDGVLVDAEATPGDHAADARHREAHGKRGQRELQATRAIRRGPTRSARQQHPDRNEQNRESSGLPTRSEEGRTEPGRAGSGRQPQNEPQGIPRFGAGASSAQHDDPERRAPGRPLQQRGSLGGHATAGIAGRVTARARATAVCRTWSDDQNR